MIPYWQIVSSILARSKGPTAFLAALGRPDAIEGNGKFREWPISPEHVKAEFGIREQEHGYDLFFTPLRFDERRLNHKAGPAGVLFADLDDAPTPVIRPSVMWETSTGMRQAVWFLDEPEHDLERWADINQRLTYYLGADRGGWMASKLLRVPGTVNWKRRDIGGHPKFNPQAIYNLKQLDAHLPLLDKPRGYSEEDVPPARPSDYLWAQKVSELWPTLSLMTRSMLMSEKVKDRSLHIVRIAKQLKNDGVSATDTFYLLWPRPWNKWRTDREDPGMLWAQIHSARAD